MRPLYKYVPFLHPARPNSKYPLVNTLTKTLLTEKEMRYLTVFTLLLAPLAALAAPSGTGTAVEAPSRVIAARQGVVTPPPCELMEPPPTEEETAARFDLFVQAFITEADISEAFKYIANDYIVRKICPASPFLLLLYPVTWRTCSSLRTWMC